MIRSVSGTLICGFRKLLLPEMGRTSALVPARAAHGGPVESEDDFNNRYVCFFQRKDIDGWEIRKALNDLAGMDLVPDPKVIIAALCACRAVNDYALAVRFLESVKDKCGPKLREIYPYILQEIRPTLTDLGVNTPEELGYDKPELFLKSVYD